VTWQSWAAITACPAARAGNSFFSIPGTLMVPGILKA
jgi:hypothetical protein